MSSRATPYPEFHGCRATDEISGRKISADHRLFCEDRMLLMGSGFIIMARSAAQPHLFWGIHYHRESGMQLTVEELLHYTDEERERWERWFRENGDDVLRMPITGERETTIGALILHIFGPEQRYIQRLRDEPLSEYRGRPSGHVDQVFGYGLETRKKMREFVQNATPKDWSRTVEFEIMGHRRRASVRKIIFHTLMHEIRHWAQIARLVRERGFAPPGGHDLLMSSALL